MPAFGRKQTLNLVRAIVRRMPVADTKPLVHTEVAAQRSQGSLEFEALWRALPRTGLVPSRSAFNPARAAKLLSKLILVEAPTAQRKGLYFRLVGQALNENVQQNMTGTNWLDVLPEAHHAEALESARLICEHPCGIWQLTPVHYERGFSQLIEVTIFPLGPGADQIPLMLGSLEFLTTNSIKPVQRGKGLSAETSQIYEFIDIGAGTPSLQI
jgi:hypothetical protein